MLLHMLVELDEDLERNRHIYECFQALRGRRPRARSCWTRRWLLRRRDLGQYDRLLVELREEDVPEDGAQYVQ